MKNLITIFSLLVFVAILVEGRSQFHHHHDHITSCIPRPYVDLQTTCQINLGGFCSSDQVPRFFLTRQHKCPKEGSKPPGQRVKRHEHDHSHIHDHSHAVEHDHGVRRLCPGLCKDETMTAVSFIC
jgi:ABC-type nickel/cobalt efflux system permease component RcnA